MIIEIKKEQEEMLSGLELEAKLDSLDLTGLDNIELNLADLDININDVEIEEQLQSLDKDLQCFEIPDPFESK